MTDTLQINTGVKRITVTRDDQPVGEIVFNPSDMIFVEKFYKLVAEFQEKEKEFDARAEPLEVNIAQDENGIPANTPERLELLKEACNYFREKVDYLFGEGTSQLAFGDAQVLDVFAQFFTGITPFIQINRVEKLQPYLSTKQPVKQVKSRKRK